MLWSGAAANTIQWRGTNCCIEIYDDGRLPGLRNGPPGAMQNYEIREITFGYVTFAPVGSVDITLEFYNSLGGPCVGLMPPDPPPPLSQGTVTLNPQNGVSLPGDPTVFQGTAWFVTIDLSGGNEFCMLAEGDGTFGNTNDNFNWSFRHNNPAAQTGGMRGGPIIAGEPTRGTFGACTFNLPCGFDPAVGQGGTGLDTSDIFWTNVDGDPFGPAGSINTSLVCTTAQTGTGCFFFGGWPANPYASYFLRLGAGPCFDGPPPVPYCTGKTTSQGCIPFLTTDAGTASASNPVAWNLRANDHIPGELGFIVYGFKKSNLDFHGGKLCVKAPLTRTPAAKAKNVPCINPFGACSAGVACRQLRRNFNATIQSGSDPMLTPGKFVSAQMFQRDPTDPTGFGDNLSNGIGFVIAP